MSMLTFLCGLVGYTCGNAMRNALEHRKPFDGAIAVATLVILLMYVYSVRIR